MLPQSTRLLRRLNPHCARALSSAASVCQVRGHAFITIEHWLLKLLSQDGGDLSLIVGRYEWNMDHLINGLHAHINTLQRTPKSKPQLCANLQQLIINAWLRASMDERCEAIRSVHLLGALLATPGLLACEAVWPLLSLSEDSLRRLASFLDRESEERPPSRQLVDSELESLTVRSTASLLPGAKEKAAAKALAAELDRFTHDLTAKAAAGEVDPVLGREDEMRQVIDILSRRRKNNPILVGEPGVGKTALVEGLALRIAQQRVPDSLKSVCIRALDLGLLQAGAGVKGEFERRLKNVIDAVRQSPVSILLFIDEAHMLIHAGHQAGSGDAANLLKPALTRGELRTLATTTWSEYEQCFGRDAAFERLFQQVEIHEPSDAVACLMLRGLKERYASHHGVHIEDAAVQAAVTLSRRYLAGRQLPDKAVDLLDSASARVRISLDCEPLALTRLKATHEALALERQAVEQDTLLNGSDAAERLQQIAEEQLRLQAEQSALEQQYLREQQLIERILNTRQAQPQQRDECTQLQAQLRCVQADKPLLSPEVNVDTVAQVLADLTGVPVDSLLKDEHAHLLELESTLGERVIGQPVALSALAQRLRAARTGLTGEDSPLGVFLLVGTSGVGKTETAMALADALFGGENSLITLNFSECQQARSASQLKGAALGDVGYGQAAILTEAVRQRPYSVVLLDEVEKAHADVISQFYQAFDHGLMRDGEGREIDFRNTVILMTSRLGSEAIQACVQTQPDAPDSTLKALLAPILREHLQPALLARVQMLIYRPLDAEAMRVIVCLKLARVAKRLQRHYGFTCQIDPGLEDAMVAACSLPDAGAHNIDNLLNQQVLPVLSQQLLQRQAAQLHTAALTLGFSEEYGVTLEFADAPNTLYSQ